MTGVTDFYGANDGGDYSIEAFAKAIEEAEFIVSYNGLWYDLHALQGAVGRHVNPKYHIDLWDRIKDSLGGEYWGKGAWKLDRVARDTIGIGKTSANGAFAPSLFQEGRIGELVTYLYRDTWILWRLFEHVVDEGWVLNPDGGRLYVDCG